MSPPSLRVLLVSANTEDEPHPVYPLAFDVLFTALIERGHAVEFWDCACHEAALAETFAQFDPGLVGVSIRNLDNNDGIRPRCYLPEIFVLIAEIKALSNVPVVLGGSGYSLFPREILLRSQADWGLTGAGETGLCELADCLACGRTLESVPGLMFRNGIHNPSARPQPRTRALQRNVKLAEAYWKRGGSINVQMKRGCPNRCIYCTYPGIEGCVPMARPATAVVDEVECLYSKAGIDSFFVVDSVFNLDPVGARSFAEELGRRALPVRWMAFFMPHGLSACDVEAWRASGLEGVEFGVDTLAPSLLQGWGKPFSAFDVAESACICAELDVPYVLYLLFGGPGETIETVRETLERVCSLPRAVVYAFQGIRIYPGTELHKRALADDVITPDQDLLEPAFYFSPMLDRADLAAELAPFAERLNWLVAGESMDRAKRMSSVIRRGGGKGSLWHLLRPKA